MKMYRTSYGDNIKEVECTKVSEKSVFYINERSGKSEHELISTHFHQWHKSKEDAVLCIKNKYEKIIETAERQISNAKEALAKLEL